MRSLILFVYNESIPIFKKICINVLGACAYNELNYFWKNTDMGSTKLLTFFNVSSSKGSSLKYLPWATKNEKFLSNLNC